MSRRRSFVRYDLRVDNLLEPEALYKRLEDYCRREGPAYHDMQPVVYVHLIGTLAFDGGSLDQLRMDEIVRHFFEPLHVRIDNNTE